jgi:hypothetical protein
MDYSQYCNFVKNCKAGEGIKQWKIKTMMLAGNTMVFYFEV